MSTVTTAIMSEKPSTDAAYSHNEKSEHAPELVEGTGRRQSVALNIVENPLQVILFHFTMTLFSTDTYS